MIKRREATRITLSCDICHQRTDLYLHSPDAWAEYPDDWTAFPPPKDLPRDIEPAIVLCPNHAHLRDTARLVSIMLETAARHDDDADGMRTSGRTGFLPNP